MPELEQVKISELPAADVLTGAERVELVQAGSNRQTTTAGLRGRSSIPFAYGDASPRTVLSIPAGTRVLAVSVVLDTGFDGIAAALSLGDGTDPERLLAPSQLDAAAPGVYGATPGVVYPIATDIRLAITPGEGASQGAGVLVITLA